MRNADTGIIFDKRIGVVDPFKDLARHNNLRHAVSQSINNAVLTAVIDEQHRLVKQLIEIPPRCDMNVVIVDCFQIFGCDKHIINAVGKRFLSANCFRRA